MHRMKKFLSTLALVLALLPAIAGAAKPIKNLIDISVPVKVDGTPFTVMEVQTHILSGCRSNRWQADVKADGTISARSNKGESYSAEVEISYSPSAYSITYVSSENLDYDQKRQKIHNTYNRWVVELSETITSLFTLPNLSITEAINTVEQLTMSQHSSFRPDFIEFNDQYISWGYGVVSTSRGSAVAISNLIFGSSKTVSRNSGDRLYFNTIESVKFNPWTRKFKQWYTAAVTDQSGRIRKHIYRTRDKYSARLFVHAMNIIVEYQRDEMTRLQESGVLSPSGMPNKLSDADSSAEVKTGMDVYDKIDKLGDLRERGLITYDEFEAEKKELLDSN